MATYTAGEQINRALRLLGVLAEGETPTAAMSQDSLMALNQMIESWNTERLSVLPPSIRSSTGPPAPSTKPLALAAPWCVLTAPPCARS